MRKNLIKAIIATLILLFLILTFTLPGKGILGRRLDLYINKIGIKKYKNADPKFYFQYSDIFEIDLDKDGNYGKNYLAGFKLKTDNRTGCDIRTGGPEINLSGPVDSINNEIIDPIKNKTKDFELIQYKKIKLGKRDGFFISFSFLDPIGARARLDQIFVQDEENRYMIICGTGEYQYSFFKKDFDVFYDSLNFGENAGNNWRKRLIFWKK